MMSILLFYCIREDISAVCTGYLATLDDATNNSRLSYEARGLCVDIISGINLDVMYVVTGKLNATPIYEVIGSRIRFSARLSNFDISLIK